MIKWIDKLFRWPHTTRGFILLYLTMLLGALVITGILLSGVSFMFLAPWIPLFPLGFTYWVDLVAGEGDLGEASYILVYVLSVLAYIAVIISGIRLKAIALLCCFALMLLFNVAGCVAMQTQDTEKTETTTEQSSRLVPK